MHRTSIIIITENTLGANWSNDFEAWGSLTEACRQHGWSYNYLKRLKFPFVYRGLTFVKVPFRTKSITI